MALKKSYDSEDVLATVAYKAIPRSWILALVVVLIMIAPWLGKADIWQNPVTETSVDIGDARPVKKARVGKWGELTLVPIVISPPMELVSIDWGSIRRPTWYFPGANAETAARMLQSAGVSATDAARMRAQAQSEPQIVGVIFKPDPVWVRALNPEIRSRIYRMLAKSGLNVDQARAFRYPGASSKDWLGPSLISPNTRRLVEPLIYRDGDYLMFADIELVRAEIGCDDELRKLSKALFRQPTVIARLSVSPSTNLDTLVEYWGRGGRHAKIRPLIESIAEGGGERYIDVVHLLPPFAQNLLYSYPTFSSGDLSKLAIVNCLWTSLNFFEPKHDDRFLDANIALKTLKEDYFIVETDFKLGDIVAFLDKEGNVFHAAVYIADDLVFSKNGISSMAPWTLMSINDVKSYYRWSSENPRLLVHRRKDF